MKFAIANTSPVTARRDRAVGAAVLLATLVLAFGSVPAAEIASSSRVEARIIDMHLNLKITSAEESQWNAVAQVMRDNESTLAPLMSAREKDASTMSAIDDLHTYAAIAEAHAVGIKKFTKAFEPLYAAMSEAQRKEADMLFRDGPAKMAKGK